MIFQQILNEESGCLSYLIGCGEAGKALVVDPGRDRVPEYLRLAAKKGLTISHILETHTHADHISGGRDLAEAVRAPILVHRSAGVAFEHQEVSDGDELRIGSVRFKIAHTPGHTPDSICVMVSDLSRGEAEVFGDAVAAGVDHQSFPGLATADQIGQTAGLFVEDLLKDHWALFYPRPRPP